MFKYQSNNFWLIVMASLLVIGGVVMLYVDSEYEKKEIKERQNRLRAINSTARFELEEALSNYALVMSGLRSYIHNSENFPSQSELHNYIKDQSGEMNNMKTLVISYLDTNHIFRYSFTPTIINPSGLVGSSVRDIVGESGVEKLNEIKKSKAFYAFNPFNTVEGWVGIPLDFGIVRNGKSLGYITAITDFKPIIDRVYDEELQEEFVFNFKTSRGDDFDRERVYDGTKVYNVEADKEYYKNFNVTSSQFVYSDANFYDVTLKIGLAYKESYQAGKQVSILLLLWYITIIAFLLFVVFQIRYYRMTNIELESQRQELAGLIANKNKFFSIIAHDLRSPLAYIVAIMNMLKSGNATKNEQSEMLLNLQDHTKNTLSLIDNLLTWSRVQTGSIIYNPTTFNIVELISETVAIFQPALKEKQIYVEIDSLLPFKVNADKDMIASVLRNLMSNAVKFTQQKGMIIISAKKGTSKLVISVNDNGLGIAEDQLKSIFNIHTSYTRLGTNAEKGTGLGLVLCKDFIEEHQGKIWVESKLNVGSTFYFTLPL
jgi:signal transduction histidine kinase